MTLVERPTVMLHTLDAETALLVRTGALLAGGGLLVLAVNPSNKPLV